MQLKINQTKKSFQLIIDSDTDVATHMEKQVIRDVYTYKEAWNQHYKQIPKPQETFQRVKIDISSL